LWQLQYLLDTFTWWDHEKRNSSRSHWFLGLQLWLIIDVNSVLGLLNCSKPSIAGDFLVHLLALKRADCTTFPVACSYRPIRGTNPNFPRSFSKDSAIYSVYTQQLTNLDAVSLWVHLCWITVQNVAPTQKENLSSRRQGYLISKHRYTLGTKKNMVKGPKGVRNQELVCWARPAANYCCNHWISTLKKELVWACETWEIWPTTTWCNN
jgi:hypothetical protein